MRLLTPILVLCALAALDVHVAEAQLNQPTRPYRGLFGGGTGDSEQVLTASASLGGGYDDNFRAEASGGSSGGGSLSRPQNIQGGVLGSASGSLAYAYSRPRGSIDLSAGTGLRYYPDMTPRTISSRNASLAGTYSLSGRTTIGIDVGASYRPFSLAGLFLGPDGAMVEQADAPILGTDQVQLDESGNALAYSLYRGTWSLAHKRSNRTTAQFGYSYRLADTQAFGGRFQQHAVRGGVERQLTRGIALELGYAVRLSDYGAGTRDDHILNVGINYNRTLSFSRNTTLSFSTGSSAVSNDRRRIYRAAGSASLTHQIGRTWSASANYNRGLRFIETIQAPVFGDSASLSFGGQLHSRLRFMSGAQASFGNLQGSNINQRSGSIGLEVGVSRNLALQTTYGYFQYEFDSSIALPLGVPRLIERQSIKLQLSVWAPLFHRARKPNATR